METGPWFRRQTAPTLTHVKEQGPVQHHLAFSVRSKELRQLSANGFLHLVKKKNKKKKFTSERYARASAVRLAWFEDKAKVCGEWRAESGHTAQRTTDRESVFTLNVCSPRVPGAIRWFSIILQHLQWEADREDSGLDPELGTWWKAGRELRTFTRKC